MSIISIPSPNQTAIPTPPMSAESEWPNPFPQLCPSRAQDSSLPGSSAQSGSGEQDQLPTQTEEVAPEVGTPDTPDTPETPVVDDRLDVVRLISISKTPHLIFVDADFLDESTY